LLRSGLGTLRVPVQAKKLRYRQNGHAVSMFRNHLAHQGGL